MNNGPMVESANLVKCLGQSRGMTDNQWTDGQVSVEFSEVFRSSKRNSQWMMKKRMACHATSTSMWKDM
jgi:hypothetical protein